ncbi:MAG: hypothetical protein Q8Q09_16530 [Deltaproteobacteria bacterium]|nr:hypothetical protein [Deltaproteobacteria bacterium]
MSRAALGHALADAYREGWEVSACDGRVRVRRRPVEGSVGPSKSDWRAVLRRDPVATLEALTGPVVGCDGERAAVLEFDAGLSRELAERVAWLWA